MGHLLLCRHSITAASASGRNLGQRTDPPLAPEGVALAERLGSALAAELAELAALSRDEVRIVSSPALRCRQTAAAVAAGIGHADDIEAYPGLLELDYGDWDGLTADECRARDPELRAAWEADPFDTRCPGGESGADVAARAFDALGPIEAWLAEGGGRAAMVIAHNHVIRLRLCALIGWPMRAYRDRLASDPAGYSIVDFGAGVPVIRRVNAVPA